MSTQNNKCEITKIETRKLPNALENLILRNFEKSCKGPFTNLKSPKVDESYGRGALAQSHWVILSKRTITVKPTNAISNRRTRSGKVPNAPKNRTKVELCGFLFLQIKKDARNVKYGYIDVVCSDKGQGKSLVKDAEDYCIVKKCKYMILHALNYKKQPTPQNPRGFKLHKWYEGQGYNHVNNPCSKIKEVPVKKNDKGRTVNNKNFYGETMGYRMTKCIDRKLIRNQINRTLKRKTFNDINTLMNTAKRTPLPPNSPIRKTNKSYKRKALVNNALSKKSNQDIEWFNSQDSLNSNKRMGIKENNIWANVNKHMMNSTLSRYR